MIVLLDNHDSYTYNIFQILQAATAREVRVLSADRAGEAVRLVEGGEVAGVVVSPGPGHPGNPEDFAGADALLDAVLARPRLPLLGVCLGHQGLAMRFGWRVVPAPEPRHGMRSPLVHTADGLFAGLPQGLRVTRYHSLAIEGHGSPVADPERPHGLVGRTVGGLRITAQSEDGVVQGFQVPERPWHAVQFHPESIASEHGEDMLRAFLGIVDEFAAPPRPVAAVSERPARRARGRQRLSLRTRPCPPDPEPLVLALGGLLQGRPGFFLADVPDEDGRQARWTVIGDASDPLAERDTEACVLRFRPGRLEIDRYARLGDGRFARSTSRTACPEPWAEIAARQRVEVGAADPASEAVLAREGESIVFRGGHAAAFAYELGVRDLGVRPPTGPCPDAVLVRPVRWFAIDRRAGRVAVCGLAAGAEDARRRREAAEAELDSALRRAGEATADGGRAGTGDAGEGRTGAGQAGQAGSGLVAGAWRASPQRYAEQIAECRRELLAGESYELCLTTAFEVEAGTRLDAWRLHRELRRSERAPFAAVLRVEDGPGPLELVGASPERFVRGRGRVWESRPIKGTAPRSADPAEDRANAAALGADRKTFAENLLIVDLVRNDLGTVCEPGSVEVPALMAVESFATVHQLVSTVRGTAREGLEPLQLVRALFPGGSMTGAPKERSVRILRGIEGAARGLYSGAFGLLGFDGRTELGMTIRAAVHAGGAWTIGAGGAIVLDSDPEAETAEAVLKASGVRRAMARVARPPATEG